MLAKSMEELADALDILAEELRRMGLELNAKKSKIFCTDPAVYASEAPVYVDAAGGMIEVVRARESHQYLGTSLPGDLRVRGKRNLAHRLKCAWAKFHLFHASLTNKHVNIKLRLRLFDAVVTPSALYGLAPSPLTKHDFETLGITQRKMLRSIVGWTKLSEDEWSDVYRRLRQKIRVATQQQPCQDWMEELQRRKSSLANQLNQDVRSIFTRKVVSWEPAGVQDFAVHTLPKRSRGRPRTRWQ